MGQGFDYKSGRIIGSQPRPTPQTMTGDQLVKSIRNGTRK